MDDVGRWWLIEDGRRRKNSWRPKDEVDMLVGVALLYMLVDQAAQFSIPTKYAQAVEANGQSVTAFREQLMISAFNQYRKLRY